MRSPLCYPGGKFYARGQIISNFPPMLRDLVAPFIGGGSVEISMAQNGTRVYGADSSEPVANFWRHAISRAESVAALVTRKWLGMDRERWRRLQDEYHELETDLERAAAFFALTRSAFCGCAFGSGYNHYAKKMNRGGLNEAAIKNLARFRAPSLSVDHADYQDTLDSHPDCYAYCDPPYYGGDQRWDYPTRKGEAGRDFDHAKLADILRARRAPWACSYNDCADIRALYKGCDIVEIRRRRNAGKHEPRQTYMDLLILSPARAGPMR